MPTKPKANKRRGVRQNWSKGRDDSKHGNKNPNLTLNRAIARRDAAQEVIDRLTKGQSGQQQPEPDAEDGDAPPRDEADNRVVVKFFWRQLGSPADEEDWKHRHGTIALIRQRMGAGAPTPRTVERTLRRLVEDENADLYSTARGGCRQCSLSEEDDLYVGLLICEGHSQRSATFLINGERAAQGLPPVGKHVIEAAEKRVQLIRRRRRSQKSGSSDLDTGKLFGSSRVLRKKLGGPVYWEVPAKSDGRSRVLRQNFGRSRVLRKKFGRSRVLGKNLRCGPVYWETSGARD